MSLSSSSVRRLFGVAALLVAAAAGAQDRPASRDEAQAVIERAKQETAEVQRRYEQAQRECEKGLFVNPCRDQARKERDQQLRVIREREVAARDALRRLDAEERAKARMQRSAEPAAEPKPGGGSVPAGRAPAAAGRAAPPTAAPRAVDPSQQEVAAENKRAEAASRKVEAGRRAAEHAAEGERRDVERAEKAARAPAESERYQERQRAAEARAEEKKRIAEENRKRREKRAEERGAAQEKAASSAPQ